MAACTTNECPPPRGTERRCVIQQGPGDPGPGHKGRRGSGGAFVNNAPAWRELEGWLCLGKIERRGRSPPEHAGALSTRGPSCYPRADRERPADMMTYAEERRRQNDPIFRSGRKGPKHRTDTYRPRRKVVPSSAQLAGVTTNPSCSAAQRPVWMRHKSTASRRATATAARLRARTPLAARSFLRGG